MKKAMKKTNENIMNFDCKFMRFYLVVICIGGRYLPAIFALPGLHIHYIVAY